MVRSPLMQTSLFSASRLVSKTPHHMAVLDEMFPAVFARMLVIMLTCFAAFMAAGQAVWASASWCHTSASQICCVPHTRTPQVSMLDMQFCWSADACVADWVGPMVQGVQTVIWRQPCGGCCSGCSCLSSWMPWRLTWQSVTGECYSTASPSPVVPLPRVKYLKTWLSFGAKLTYMHLLGVWCVASQAIPVLRLIMCACVMCAYVSVDVSCVLRHLHLC